MSVWLQRWGNGDVSKGRHTRHWGQTASGDGPRAAGAREPGNPEGLAGAPG